MTKINLNSGRVHLDTGNAQKSVVSWGYTSPFPAVWLLGSTLQQCSAHQHRSAGWHDVGQDLVLLDRSQVSDQVT